MKPIIRVQNISKCYRIGAPRVMLRERLNEIASTPLALVRGRGRVTDARTVWALKDVAFDIEAGEVVGIVGANGSGKSTLLKTLSLITEPTRGRVELYGRFGSLLEVGTGFHPELTGRENIYLNGAILGMKRAEIKQHFDEIVAFAEVDPFVDTPVKRYSTGMYLRLAFAVAAHLRSEILLIDEVLAVGDREFQKKCLGKVEGVAREGRTVLFVSHNMGAVTELCPRALWLNRGRLVADGPARETVAAYFADLHGGSHRWERAAEEEGAGGATSEARLRAVQICQGGASAVGSVSFDEEFTAEIEYEVAEATSGLSVVLRLVSETGTVIFTSSDADGANGLAGGTRPAGVHVVACRIPGSLLRPGKMFLTVGVRRNGIWCDLRETVLMFEVSPVGSPLHPDRKGVITPLLEWTTRTVTNG